MYSIIIDVSTIGGIKMYTVNESAEILGCSIESVYKKINILGITKNKWNRYDLSETNIVDIKNLLIGSGRPPGSCNKKNT